MRIKVILKNEEIILDFINEIKTENGKLYFIRKETEYFSWDIAKVKSIVFEGQTNILSNPSVANN